MNGTGTASCTQVPVSISARAYQVVMLVYAGDPASLSTTVDPSTSDWFRLVRIHRALPNHALNLPAWCGEGRGTLVPGSYTIVYDVQWTAASDWQLSRPTSIEVDPASP